jgi:hypothetical protein
MKEVNELGNNNQSLFYLSKMWCCPSPILRGVNRLQSFREKHSIVYQYAFQPPHVTDESFAQRRLIGSSHKRPDSNKLVYFYPKNAPTLKAIVWILSDGWSDVDELYDDYGKLAEATQCLIIVWEYPGYGTLRVKEQAKTGKLGQVAATPQELKREGFELFGTVNKLSKDAGLPLLIIGTRVGGALACEILVKKTSGHVHGLLLDRVFTSTSDVLYHKLPWMFKGVWLWEPNLFSVVDLLQKIPEKSLDGICIQHAKEDTLGPEDTHQRLFAAARWRRFNLSTVKLKRQDDWDKHHQDAEHVFASFGTWIKETVKDLPGVSKESMLDDSTSSSSSSSYASDDESYSSSSSSGLLLDD